MQKFKKQRVLIISIFIIALYFIYKPSKFWQFDKELARVKRKIFEYNHKKDIELKRQNNRNSEVSMFYRRRPETSHIDCGRILNGDTIYTSQFLNFDRLLMVETPNLDMSCTGIKNRVSQHSEHLKPLKMGVAFAKIVYTDYELIEKQMQMTFHPQNFFCFAVDRKSNEKFKWRIKQLEKCFENVFVLPITDLYDRGGQNQNMAHYKCMQKMIKIPGWNYFFTLQNHDIITKSVYELERIYEIFGGANDISIMIEENRVDYSLDWTPKTLKLFRNESEISENVLNTPLFIVKSDVEGSISRDSVDWMVHSVNLNGYIRQWNQSNYACDEQFLGTFQVNSQLGMPGHFTDECIKKRIETRHVSRLTKWVRKETDECASLHIRHGVCLFGIEDFPSVATSPHLLFNKMHPDFDYSIIECTAELLHNRTFLGQIDHPLNPEIYENLVQVKYHKNHQKPNYQLNCTNEEF